MLGYSITSDTLKRYQTIPTIEVQTIRDVTDDLSLAKLFPNSVHYDHDHDSLGD